VKVGNYYDITSLPVLGELGSTPPLRASQLFEHLAESPGSQILIEVLFLLDDLLQREAFLAGEVDKVDPVVLTAAQARNEEPLPDKLAGGSEVAARAVQADNLWEAYFRHAAKIADQCSSAFLAGWVAWEVALRNALAIERASLLGLESTDYLVAVQLADGAEDLGDVLSQWASAETPLAGLGVLTRARWAWITEHEAWFTFKDDELAAYAAKLMLLGQWHRLAQADADKRPVATDNDQPQSVEN